MELSNLLSAMPGAIAQGLIWGIMAIGVFITYKVLDFADLTVDGTMATGGAVFVMLMLAGWNLYLALLVAVLAGMVAGLITGLFHSAMGIPAILSGILTQLSLYSINLWIMGYRANQGINVNKYALLVSSRNVRAMGAQNPIFVMLIIMALLIAALYWFFGTELGCSLRATGANAAMARAQGINTSRAKILGLMISNGIVALASALFSQYQGSVDINMGRGAIVIGLASIVIGEVFCEAIFKKGCNFSVKLLFIVLGGVLYYMVMTLILWLRLDPNDLKLFTALIVALFLAVPYLQKQSKSSFSRAKKRGQKEAIGQ